MSNLFRDFHIQHSTPEAVLVQLPDGKGFGRLSKATLGGDILAERLLRGLAGREHVRAIPTRSHDAQGYRLLNVNLRECSSAFLTYPPAVQQLVQTLVRKHLLIGIGTTTAAQVVRRSAKGTVLRLPSNMTAVAALEHIKTGHGRVNGSSRRRRAAQANRHAPDGEGSDEDPFTSVNQQNSDEEEEEESRDDARGVEVRLLNYDVTADVVNVTAKEEVVEGTPLDTAVAAAALATVHAGDVLSCTVLLSSTDDGCAVVQIPVATLVAEDAYASSPPTDATAATTALLGYYMYSFGGAKAAVPPVVGSKLDLVVEYCPEHPALYDVTPFVVLSGRRGTFQHLPVVRRGPTVPTTSAAPSSSFVVEAAAAAEKSAPYGLVGYFPWRAEYAEKMNRRNAKGEDEDYDDGDVEGTGHRTQQPRTRRRKLEEAIDAYERGMDKALPTTPQEFQRLLLANPNSSYLWTQYMAHHVGLQQYEAARQVAEKALARIGVREKDELLNVWVAYLNVENLYGTEESLSAVFRRAQERQLNQLALFERLADIYAASRKPNPLLALCRVMTHKFRTERRTWERLGIVLVDQGKRDQLKRTLKDMGEVLRRDDATLALVHIAIHEYKRGSAENGRALFEGLLRKVPKRSDVWSTYLDQEMGLLTRKEPNASTLQVRQVFQRAVAMSFSAKVMQQLLTRFLAFEKALGSPADVEAVKERARIYVEAKIQSVTEAGVSSTSSA